MIHRARVKKSSRWRSNDTNKKGVSNNDNVKKVIIGVKIHYLPGVSGMNVLAVSEYNEN